MGKQIFEFFACQSRVIAIQWNNLNWRKGRVTLKHLFMMETVDFYLIMQVNKKNADGKDPKTSYTHLQCVHKKCLKFGEGQS
jgi:hypothetical protein